MGVDCAYEHVGQLDSEEELFQVVVGIDSGLPKSNFFQVNPSQMYLMEKRGEAVNPLAYCDGARLHLA
jgi:hypothetical protein